MENTNTQENIKIFLNEIADYIEEPTEANGFLLIPLKKSMLTSCKTLSGCRKNISDLAEKMGLNHILDFSFTDNNQAIGPAYKLDLLRINSKPDSLTQTMIALPNFDIEKFHVERLKTAFHKVTADEIKESIQFLGEKGWKDADFTREFDISKTTIWRYKSKVMDKTDIS